MFTIPMASCHGCPVGCAYQGGGSMLPSFILIVRPSAYRRQAILLLLRRVSLQLCGMSTASILKIVRFNNSISLC
jgi:hypothetical protein